MSTDKASHTHGPWFVNWAGSGKDGKFVYDECYVYAPGTGVDDVAVAADIADPLTGKPSIANARLIAAAPDMLAALKAIMPWIPTTSAADGGASKYSENVRAADQVRAAITKAEQP